jgi:hypothetical protein
MLRDFAGFLLDAEQFEWNRLPGLTRMCLICHDQKNFAALFFGGRIEWPLPSS